MVPSALGLLHAGAPIAWSAWTVHWSTVVGLAALALLYVVRARRGPVPVPQAAGGAVASTPRRSPSPTQRALFFTGLFVIFASLNGPIHDLSDYYLFSAHMLQHLLLTLVAMPLLIAGTPGWMLRPALALPGVGAAARWLTSPRTCFVLFNVVIALWHIPAFYNTAMAYHGVHIVQHLTLMVVAVLMWWPLMSPLPELPRLAYPGQMLYCFLMIIPMSIVAIYIALADRVLYPAYASAPRMWGISPMEDQLIGGLIMWVPGGLFFLGVMTVIFFRWAARESDDTVAAQVDWAGAR